MNLCKCQRLSVLYQSFGQPQKNNVQNIALEIILTPYLGWLERVVRWEVDSNQKDATSIWAFGWTHNRCLPVEHIFCHGACSVGKTDV